MYLLKILLTIVRCYIDFKIHGCLITLWRLTKLSKSLIISENLRLLGVMSESVSGNVRWNDTLKSARHSTACMMWGLLAWYAMG